MLFKTHIAIAFLFGLVGIQLFHPSNQILFISFVMIAGILPDIDHPKTKLGKIFKHFNLFEHRGFMHSFLVLPIIALLLYYFHYSQFALPIIFGYVSHLVSDMITKEGIMILHPLTRFKIKGFIKTGGLTESVLFLATLVCCVYLLFIM